MGHNLIGNGFLGFRVNNRVVGFHNPEDWAQVSKQRMKTGEFAEDYHCYMLVDREQQRNYGEPSQTLSK